MPEVAQTQVAAAPARPALMLLVLFAHLLFMATPLHLGPLKAAEFGEHGMAARSGHAVPTIETPSTPRPSHFVHGAIDWAAAVKGPFLPLTAPAFSAALWVEAEFSRVTAPLAQVPKMPWPADCQAFLCVYRN